MRPGGAARSQAPGSVKNRAPPSPFQAGASATAARDVVLLPPEGPLARSGPIQAREDSKAEAQRWALARAGRL